MAENPVLQSTAFLLKDAKYVEIDYSRIAEIADRHALQGFESPVWEEEVFPASNYKGAVFQGIIDQWAADRKEWNTIDFFCLGNGINFCYRNPFSPEENFETTYRGRTYQGAMAMWACLKKGFENGTLTTAGEFDASKVVDMSTESLDDLFHYSEEEGLVPHQIPLFRERLNIFREIGARLLEKYDGRFINLIEASNHRLFSKGEGFVERLVSDFPSFNDSAYYREDKKEETIGVQGVHAEQREQGEQAGKTLYFHKRAQLAAASLMGRYRNIGLFFMEDKHELTVFADYVLPRNLRDMGITVYKNGLAEKVNGQQIITQRSREELEIRAVGTLHPAELLFSEMNSRRERAGFRPINKMQFDYWLWSMRGYGGNVSHCHLTPTTAY